MLKIEKDKINLDKCLKEIESIGQKIEKREKEIAALKERKKELNDTIVQSVLKDNKITIAELVLAVNEVYAEKETSNIEDALLQEEGIETEETD